MIQPTPLIPAKAATQTAPSASVTDPAICDRCIWIPAFAGMSGEG